LVHHRAHLLDNKCQTNMRGLRFSTKACGVEICGVRTRDARATLEGYRPRVPAVGTMKKAEGASGMSSCQGALLRRLMPQRLLMKAGALLDNGQHKQRKNTGAVAWTS